MTNREYMESLSDEELAEFIDSEPWEDCVFDKWWFGFSTRTEALVDWLNKYHEEHKEE